MKIDGFRVNLGQASKGENLQAKVSKEHISALLDEARKNPDFERNKGSYEFRLRKHKGDAVLELRRPTTGFFAKLSPWSNSRRSQERSDAYAAIRQHMNLLTERQGGAIRKQEARQLAGNVLKLDDLTSQGVAERELYGLLPSKETLKKGLSEVLASGLKDSIEATVLPKGLEVRSQTMSFLNRASVSINEHGRLVIKSPTDQPGNGQKNLEAVISFLGDQCKPVGGESLQLDTPGDSRLKNLAESFLLHIRSGSERAISEPVGNGLTEKTGVEMHAKGKTIEFQVQGDFADLSVNLFQSGTLEIGRFNEPFKTVDFGAKLEFKMSVDTLMKGLSNIGDLNVYKEMDFHIAPTLSGTSKTRLEELDDLRLQTRERANKAYAEEADQRRLEEQMRLINRGPTQSPFGEH